MRFLLELFLSWFFFPSLFVFAVTIPSLYSPISLFKELLNHACHYRLDEWRAYVCVPVRVCTFARHARNQKLRPRLFIYYVHICVCIYLFLNAWELKKNNKSNASARMKKKTFDGKSCEMSYETKCLYEKSAMELIINRAQRTKDQILYTVILIYMCVYVCVLVWRREWICV